jgi:hypothetical protein
MGGEFSLHHIGTLGPTQTLCSDRSSARGLKQPEGEAYKLSLANANVKNVWSYASVLPLVFVACCLFRHRDISTYSVQYCSVQYCRTPRTTQAKELRHVCHKGTNNKNTSRNKTRVCCDLLSDAYMSLLERVSSPLCV